MWYTGRPTKKDMRNLQDLENLVLIDMLVEYTQQYTRLFRNFTGVQDDPEYLRCKETILDIISELNKRGMLTYNQTKIVEQ